MGRRTKEERRPKLFHHRPGPGGGQGADRAPDPEAWAKLVADEAAPRILDEAIGRLTALSSFDASAIETELKGLCAALELKPRQAFLPIRIGIAGSTVAPGLYESIAFLGRDEALARLQRARTAVGES